MSQYQKTLYTNIHIRGQKIYLRFEFGEWLDEAYENVVTERAGQQKQLTQANAKLGEVNRQIAE